MGPAQEPDCKAVHGHAEQTGVAAIAMIDAATITRDWRRRLAMVEPVPAGSRTCHADNFTQWMAHDAARRWGGLCESATDRIEVRITLNAGATGPPVL